MDLLNRLESLLADEVRPYAWGVVFVAGLCVVALGPLAFNIVLVSDDWRTAVQPLAQSDWAVAIGRWGIRVQWDLLPFHSFNRSFVVLGNALLLLGAGLWAARIAGFRSVWAVTLFLGFFVLAPVWIETYLFVLGQFGRALGLTFAVIQAWATFRFCEQTEPRPRDYGYWMLAVGAFVMAASFNQIYVILAMEIFGVGLLMRVAQQADKYPASVLWRYYATRPIVIYLAGLAMYFLSIRFFQWFYGIPPTLELSYSPFGLTGQFLAEQFGRLEYFAGGIWQFFFTDMHLVPAIFGWAILAGVAVCVIDLRKRLRAAHDKRLGLWLFVLSVLGAVLLVPFVFGLVRELNMRMITPTAILFSFFLAYPLQRLGPGIFRSAFAVLGYFLLLLAGYQFSSAATVKQLNNQLDLHMVSSLVEQLRHEPRLAGLPEDQKLLINLVGQSDFGSGAPFAMDAADEPFSNSFINCGLFNCKGKDLEYAARLFGYDRQIEVRLLTGIQAWNWLNDHLTGEELAGLQKTYLSNWWTAPEAGLFVGDGPEVLVLLEDLPPPP